MKQTNRAIHALGACLRKIGLILNFKAPDKRDIADNSNISFFLISNDKKWQQG